MRETLGFLGVAEVDLEDVLQDVLLAALGAWERFDATRYARTGRFGGGDEDEEDEEAWRAASAALARMRPLSASSPLLAWLYGIAWRQVSHYLERAHRRHEVASGLRRPLGSARRDLGPGPEQELAAKQRAQIIGEALARLDVERRAVLILHDVLELKIPEIAAQLGVNPNTAQNRLRLAREDFRRVVRWMGEEKRRALQLDERGPLPGTEPPEPPPGRPARRGSSAGARRKK